jgi:2-polyprenyl-3-methyl-5-hydroxy-6-metoxy-1,4-benzoquinol methylase
MTGSTWHERTPESVDWYDRGINWEARFQRELPVICDVLGPPSSGGIVDAGCGTGRHVAALAERGYRVTGVDLSEAMVDVARRHASDSGAEAKFVCCPFEELTRRVDGGADGLICIGNSLAAAASEQAVEQAVWNFAGVLRPGGRMFVQALNFPPMREEVPCVRGPRVTSVEGVEYVSVRMFDFVADAAAGRHGRADVTNVTLWHDGTWRQKSHRGTLYPATLDELRRWCEAAGLQVLNTFGAYDRTPFDPTSSTDLLLVAERKP